MLARPMRLRGWDGDGVDVVWVRNEFQVMYVCFCVWFSTCKFACIEMCVYFGKLNELRLADACGCSVSECGRLVC